MDEEFPDGNYEFQLRERLTPTTVIVSTTLPLTASSFPPAPMFSMYAAAANAPTQVDFTVSWQPFAGATTNDSDLTFVVTDSDGSEVLRLPDACRGRPVPVTSTEITIPAGLLQPNHDDSVTLEFHRWSTLGRTLPGRVGGGITGAGTSTTMRLHTASPTSGAPARIASIAPSVPGPLLLMVEGPVGVPVHVEAASSLTGPWSIRLPSVQQVSSPQAFTVPLLGEAGFYWAVSGN